MRHAYRTTMIAVLAVLALLAGACGDSDDGEVGGGGGGGSDGDAIRVGGIFNLTGPAAVIGVSERYGAELSVEQINEAGGIDGQMIELEILDAESDPDTAVQHTRDLVRDGYQVIIGPTLGSLCNAARQVAESADVTMFCLSPVPEPSELVFVIEYSPAAILGGLPAKWLGEQGLTRVACLHAADTSGQAYLATLQQAAPQFGVEVVAVESFQPGDADVTAQLTRIRNADPDVVFSCASGGDHATVLRGMQQLGMNLPVLLGAGGTSYDVAEMASGFLPDGGVFSVGNTVLVPNQLPQDFPGRQAAIEFFDAYVERFDERPSTVAAYAADSMSLIGDALRGTEEIEGPAIADALEQVCDFQGVLTQYCLSPDDHSGYQLDQPIIVRWTAEGDFELEEIIDAEGIPGREGAG